MASPLPQTTDEAAALKREKNRLKCAEWHAAHPNYMKEYDADPERKEKKKESNAVWRAAHPGHASDYDKNAERGYNRNADRRLKRYKAGAAGRKYEFELTDEHALRLFGEECFYCDHKDSRLNGIDRTVNAIGYFPGNCVAACGRCNMGKGKKSVESFIEMCNAVARKHPL